MTYQIEKNIPLLLPRKEHDWPFGRMAVGDSFLVPEPLRQKAANAAAYFTRKANWRFVSRKVDGGMVRFWRTA